jgi:rhamnogalacturonyl hydrolase YesR
MPSSKRLALVLALALGGCRHAGTAQAPGAPAPSVAPTNVVASDAVVRDVVTRVARRNVRAMQDGEYPQVETVSAALEAKQPDGLTWNYPWGVVLYGTQRAAEVLGDKELDAFVLEHNRMVGRYYRWTAETQARLEDAGSAAVVQRATTTTAPATPEEAAPKPADFIQKSKVRGLMRLGHLDSCGAMGTQLLESMLRHPEQVTSEQKEIAARVAEWVANKQERLPDGTFWRPKSMNGTVWIDDLYMGGVFLTRWAKYTGDSKYLDDAARQVINMAARVQDVDGVWYHGYFENEKKTSPIKWGRGNGWAMLSTVEVLSALPESHPDRAKVLDVLRRHIEGVKKHQAPSGMWRQIVDDPSLWEETSSTAMYSYSIARAVNRGWIDASNMSVARRGFAGIAANVTADGSVDNTCQGTNIGMDADYYVKRTRPSNDPHGPGVVLLAGAEILSAARAR